MAKTAEDNSQTDYMHLEAMKQVQTPRQGRVLTYWIGGIFLVVVLCLFLPWTQNINSQGFGSANLARRSVALFQQYLAIGLIFGVQAVQLAKLAGAAAELVGGGGNGLVDSLRGAAGLADLDIVTDDSGNVAVQAGTYIQDNVYLGVQAGAGGQSRVTINLDVTKDLKVTGAAGQSGDSSLGVFYERDY